MFFFLAYFTLYNWLQFHPSHQNWFKWILSTPSLFSYLLLWNSFNYFSIVIILQKHPVQFSSVTPDSFWPHGLQHTRLLCPLPPPGACPNSCPLRQWCHPTISSSVIPFSSSLQSFQASGSFPMSQFFDSGGQGIGVSTSISILPVKIQDWFPLG